MLQIALLLFCFWLGPAEGLAQPGLPLEYVGLETATTPLFFSPILLPFSLPTSQQPPPVHLSHAVPSIPSAYDFEQLGLFCKFEVQLERKARLPIKFRLGEVGYTEWLEYGYGQ